MVLAKTNNIRALILLLVLSTMVKALMIHRAKLNSPDCTKVNTINITRTLVKFKTNKEVFKHWSFDTEIRGNG